MVDSPLLALTTIAWICLVYNSCIHGWVGLLFAGLRAVALGGGILWENSVHALWSFCFWGMRSGEVMIVFTDVALRMVQEWSCRRDLWNTNWESAGYYMRWLVVWIILALRLFVAIDINEEMDWSKSLALVCNVSSVSLSASIKMPMEMSLKSTHFLT